MFWINEDHREILPVCLVHGGAGNIKDDVMPWVTQGVKVAARIGFKTLKKTNNAVDAVHQAVRTMELDPMFNAGFGSSLTWNGKVEMDAAIMNGYNLDAGCVSIARNILHPIDLARRIMQSTEHKYLAGDGAMSFAMKQGFSILPDDALVTPYAISALAEYKNFVSNPMKLDAAGDENRAYSYKLLQKFYATPSTVGAIAVDKDGNVAVASSSGGIIGKMPGRIGETTTLGAGIYADNECGAISVSGPGETILRYNVASRILTLKKFRSLPIQQASMEVLDEVMRRFSQTSGSIGADPYGNVGIYFTTSKMPWAYVSRKKLHFGTERGEDNCESLTAEPDIDIDENK